MDLQQLKLAYKGRGSASGQNALFLEQRDWDPYDGAISNTTMANALANFIYGSQSSEPIDYDPDAVTNDPNYELNLTGASLGASSNHFAGSNPTNVQCSLDADGCMTATIYAYPVPWNLRYRLHVTHGSVSSRVERVQEFRELIQVRLQDPGTAIRPDYPVRQLIDYEWFGDVYNSEGDVINGPNIEVIENELFLDGRVYGTIDVTYSVERHFYTVEIQPDYSRPEGDEYKSVAYAPFEGGVEWEEIDPAPSVNFDASSCGFITRVIFADDELPTVDGNDRIDTYNYCSGILTRTRYT